MIRRVFASAPAHVTVREERRVASDGGGVCFAEVHVNAETRERPTIKLCSKRILVVVIPGAWIVEAVLRAASHLGCESSLVNIALRAAREVGTRIPSGEDRICLAIIEGLKAAVRGEARQAHSSNGQGHVRVLPNLLGLAELTALTLDLSAGWRVRVHDVGSSMATADFVQRLISTAHEEACLPLAA